MLSMCVPSLDPKDGMGMGLLYKAIYVLVRERVEAFANAVGNIKLLMH